MDQSQHHIAIHLNQNIHKKIYVKIEQQSFFFLHIMHYNVVFPARHEIVSSDTLWNFLVKNQVINLNDIHKIKLGYRSPVDPKNGFGVFLLLVPKELLINFDIAVYKFCSDYRCFLLYPRENELDQVPISTTTLNISMENQFISYYEEFIPIRIAFSLRRAGFCSRIIYHQKIEKQTRLFVNNNNKKNINNNDIIINNNSSNYVIECELMYIEHAKSNKKILSPPKIINNKNNDKLLLQQKGDDLIGTIIKQSNKNNTIINNNNTNNNQQNNNKTRRGWGGKKRARNYNRASIFRTWCVDTFGSDRMNSNGGVLDVAGGKGELAYELLAYGRIKNITIVDPRPYNIFGMLKRLTRGHIDRIRRRTDGTVKKIEIRNIGNNVGNDFSENISSIVHIYSNLLLPKHNRCWFEYPLPINHTRDDDNVNILSSNNTTKNDDDNVNNNNTNNGKKKKSIFASRSLYFNEELKSEDEQVYMLSNKMSKCSVVVGMHPDQATEAIVDFALKENKPFAIVPCCVFPKLFQNRKLKNGNDVSKFNDFIQYLMEKDPEKVKQTTLNFSGRNICLYGNV